MGGAGRQFSSCFDDRADLESSPNGGLKVVEIPSFCFLLDFQTCSKRKDKGGGSREGITRRASRDL